MPDFGNIAGMVAELAEAARRRRSPDLFDAAGWTYPGLKADDRLREGLAALAAQQIEQRASAAPSRRMPPGPPEPFGFENGFYFGPDPFIDPERQFQFRAKKAYEEGRRHNQPSAYGPDVVERGSPWRASRGRMIPVSGTDRFVNVSSRSRGHPQNAEGRGYNAPLFGFFGSRGYNEELRSGIRADREAALNAMIRDAVMKIIAEGMGQGPIFYDQRSRATTQRR